MGGIFGAKGTLLSSGAELCPLLEALGRWDRISTTTGQKHAHIFGALGLPKSLKSQTRIKKNCPESGVGKWLPELAGNGPMRTLYTKYNIMLREVEEHPFRCVLGSFRLPVGVTLHHFVRSRSSHLGICWVPSGSLSESLCTA